MRKQNKRTATWGENPPACSRMWRTWWWWWTLPPTFWGRILTRDVTPTVASSSFPLLRRHISSNEARWCPCVSHTRIGRRTRTPSLHLDLFVVVVVVKKEDGDSSVNAPQWSWEDEHSHSSEKQADRGAPRSREGPFWQAAGKRESGPAVWGGSWACLLLYRR